MTEHRIRESMRTYFTDRFVLPLPDQHRFPMLKYQRLRELVTQRGIVTPDRLLEPPPATDEELLTVHTWEYLSKVKSGTLSPAEVRLIGFPWSRQLVERSRRSVGATLAGARCALDQATFAANLAGGTHHAFSDHGEGFCVFNDAAVAVRTLQAEGQIDRAVIIDCDVHQGNGTAAIFAADASVFTLSLHGRRNYPRIKPPSDLDVALEDGTGDDEYLAALEAALGVALERARAELAIYLAGADPYVGDRLGRLALSVDGLAQRDRLVLSRLHSAGVPTVVVMAGGYSTDPSAVDQLCEIHCNTVRIAASLAAATTASTTSR